MYRAIEIANSLLPLIGWRQHYNSAEFQILESNTTSLSGLYYQDVHPLLTLDGIRSIAPDFSKINFPEWNDTTTYAKSTVLKAGNSLYRAKVGNTGKNPTESPVEWEKYDLFSDWLETKTKASITNLISRFFTEKMLDSSAKNILERKYLFDGSGRLSDLVQDNAAFVGFEIVPIRADGVIMKIEKLATQFNGVGQIKFYLFHSSQVDPVKVITVNRTKANSMEWHTIDPIELPYISAGTDTGGSWYLGYLQTELPNGIQAIEKSKDWSKKPCESCSSEEYTAWTIWSKYCEFHPFRVKQPIAGKLWDVADNLYTYETNYGLNCCISLSCDITDVLVEQRSMFIEAMRWQVASDFIREMAYNPNYRISRTQQNFSKAELLYELDGDSQSMKKSGVNYNLKNAIEAVKLDTTGINRICLPCKSNGVRYKTV